MVCEFRSCARESPSHDEIVFDLFRLEHLCTLIRVRLSCRRAHRNGVDVASSSAFWFPAVVINSRFPIVDRIAQRRDTTAVSNTQRRGRKGRNDSVSVGYLPVAMQPQKENGQPLDESQRAKNSVILFTNRPLVVRILLNTEMYK